MESSAIYQKTIEVFAPRVQDLVDYALQLRQTDPGAFKLTHSLLLFLRFNFEQLEEILDEAHARTNSRWFPFRETVATLKNFSAAGYELLHIYYACRNHKLADSSEEFLQKTEEHLQFIANIIWKSMLDFLAYCEKLGLAAHATNRHLNFQEEDAVTHLPKDRSPQGPSEIKNRIDALAISVLNTTEEVKNFKSLAQTNPADWNSLDFDFLCETKLRTLEVNMHTLQSLYDTYISDSDSEDPDPDLLSLHDSILVVLRLLRIASIYIHFYERHMIALNVGFISIGNVKCGAVQGKAFAEIMLTYLAKYIAKFLVNGRKFCTALLQKYCVEKTVEVKIPPYIGFHVRPSTLVAAIVMHYGCSVKMILGDSEYDASQFLNITLANNYLDQKKRAFLMEQLQNFDLSQYEQAIQEGLNKEPVLEQILLDLASLNIIHIYKIPFDLTHFDYSLYNNLRETVYNAVVYLMNNDRQLGIVFNATVTFTGPEQAVNDIAALADANYCETDRGEDLPLPKQLDYLSFRRKTIQRNNKQ